MEKSTGLKVLVEDRGLLKAKKNYQSLALAKVGR
jgi:hypothetical protein